MSTVSPSMSAITLEKIQDKTALVGVVGLGYVGLPLIHAFIRGGLKCIGYDIDQKKIDSILDKISDSGYDSLTKKEKEYLFKVGKNKDK